MPILAALALALAPVAPAADPPGFRIAAPAELISLFKTICMAHAGDPAGQLAVAQAAPFNFKRDESSAGNTYRAEPFQLNLDNDAKGQPACAVTTALALDTDFAALSAKVGGDLSLGTPRKIADDTDDIVGWSIAADGRILLLVSLRQRYKIGTLGLFATPKP